MSRAELLSVENLSVHVGAKVLLQKVSFALRPGDVLTLLGESGAGKSLLAQAVMGNLPAALRASGSVTLNGSSSRAADAAARRTAWGRQLALLPQEPSLALDPLMRIAPQLAEVHALVKRADTPTAQASALRELAAAGLPDVTHQFPWQLSGGMAQRAAATMALAGGARVVLADEPTKGLDEHWRQHTVAMLQDVQRHGGCVIVITHDLRVARALGGQLIVLRQGEVVEQGATSTILADPQHAFTRQLLAADPANWPRRTTHLAVPGDVVLSAHALQKSFAQRVVFTDIHLQLHKRETLVVQGPSGSGKSTLGNVLLGLMPADRGSLKRANGLAATAFQKLYQDPVASFAPQITLECSLRDVAKRHACGWQTVLQRLARLGVAEDLLTRLPTEVSGGELQRLALARVLMVQPALLFADEPTSRLDPISQQEALELLLDVVDETGAALLLVTHDHDLAQAVGNQFITMAADK